MFGKEKSYPQHTKISYPQFFKKISKFGSFCPFMWINPTGKFYQLWISRNSTILPEIDKFTLHSWNEQSIFAILYML